MKKAYREEDERQPFELKQKISEIKEQKADTDEMIKEEQAKEERVSEARFKNSLRENVRNILRAGALPFSLKIKRTHSLGDFYGKFHPSKSRKGIKRSEG